MWRFFNVNESAFGQSVYRISIEVAADMRWLHVEHSFVTRDALYASVMV